MTTGSFTRRTLWSAVTAVALVAGSVGCSSDDVTSTGVSATSAAGSPASTPADDDAGAAAPITATDEPRPVPTVPAEGRSDSPADADGDGVIEAVPTIAPPPPPDIDPNAPLPTQAPPTTELVGDLQPDPEATAPPPPPSVPDEPTVCELLAPFDVPRLVADASGVELGAPVEDGSNGDVCRFDGNNTVVEVHRIDEAVVLDDWYRREGIEPVGEVGGEAVGLPLFTTPDGNSGDGYTVALTSGRRGIVVAVAAASDARLIAAEVALAAAQAI